MHIEDVLIEATRTVQGNLKKGQRPHIQFEGAIYRNDVLSNSYSLVGKTLKILFNPGDIRVLRAYLPNGNPIGSLIVTGKWATRPHSLDLRRYINRLKYRKVVRFAMGDDPFEAIGKHLSENAVNSKSHRGKLAQFQQETERWLAELKEDSADRLHADCLADDHDGSNMAPENEDECDIDLKSLEQSTEKRPTRNVKKTIIL